MFTFQLQELYNLLLKSFASPPRRFLFITKYYRNLIKLLFVKLRKHYLKLVNFIRTSRLRHSINLSWNQYTLRVLQFPIVQRIRAERRSNCGINGRRRRRVVRASVMSIPHVTAARDGAPSPPLSRRTRDLTYVGKRSTCTMSSAEPDKLRRGRKGTRVRACDALQRTTWNGCGRRSSALVRNREHRKVERSTWGGQTATRLRTAFDEVTFAITAAAVELSVYCRVVKREKRVFFSFELKTSQKF